MSGSELPFNYDDAARTYDTHRRGRGPYFGALLQLAAQAPDGIVLEIGAGTGNNTEAFHEDTGRRMVALEPSRGMIAQGIAKVGRARWVRGRVEALPFAGKEFAMAYGTYMLHHVRDLDQAFSECFRCLAVGGVAAFVTVSQEFIKNHPSNDYFPSFAAVDCARFQPIGEVMQALARVGFRDVTGDYTRDAPRAIDGTYADKIEGKFISTDALLPEAELATGLARLRGDIVANGGALPRAMVREAVLVYGWKR